MIIIKMGEGGLTTAFLQLFVHHRKHPEPGAADEFQLGQIEHDILDRAGQHGRKFAFQLGRGGSVKLPVSLMVTGPLGALPTVFEFEFREAYVYEVLALCRSGNLTGVASAGFRIVGSEDVRFISACRARC